MKKQVVFMSLCLLALILFTLTPPKKQVQTTENVKIKIGYPTRLIIPKINVNTNVQYVGINKKGEMEVPSNTTDVGWFSQGAIPGEIGSAVMDGHFNGEDGKSGVFINLKNLKIGDLLYTVDNVGLKTTFSVYKIDTFDPGHEEEVFGLNDNAYLNLITCEGIWDDSEQSYAKRLVIFAKKV